jgi:hypothetical protein
MIKPLSFPCLAHLVRYMLAHYSLNLVTMIDERVLLPLRLTLNLCQRYRDAIEIHDTDLHAMVMHDTLVACQLVRDEAEMIYVDFEVLDGRCFLDWSVDGFIQDELVWRI